MGVAAAGAAISVVGPAIGVVSQLAGQVLGQALDKMQKMQGCQNKASTDQMKTMSESLDKNFDKIIQAFGSNFSSSLKGAF
ncbi:MULTISPECIES: hypothetical protein [Burkholderia]|uniref:Uncharacterized protein n=1 Tax=Burkholderia pyrrocinia TaxID=60550 RepID=A0A318HUD1_BURPY|nr:MULTISPECIES: hypothetical protein [Burkholderia]PXX21922.1 hypothetical protein NA66_104411 [Burkholderia pyrrocinia]SFW89933.1 hypothetical protein SAMN03159384_06908 [Burkholderia sp. NFACC33-1]SFY46369.1 hypothetical protein SAMN03159408_06904 [Burkholderia sp. NFPP32]